MKKCALKNEENYKPDSQSSFYQQNQSKDNAEQPKQETEQENEKIQKKIKKIKKDRKSKFMLIEEAQKNSRKSQVKKTANEIVNTIIHQMVTRHKADLKCYGKKPATAKVSYVATLNAQLRNVYVCNRFLEMDGLRLFEKWLQKLPDGHQPTLHLRKHLFEILEFLRVKEMDIVKAEQLHRIVRKNQKSQNKQIRALCESIITKWKKISYNVDDE